MEATPINILHPGKPTPRLLVSYVVEYRNALATFSQPHTHWFFQFESYGPAILVTIGAALLIACGYRRNVLTV